MLAVGGFVAAMAQCVSDPVRRRSLGERAARAPFTREENDMHPSIVRAVAPLQKTPRSAKVIQLETRREARLERERLELQSPRSAA